MTDAAFAEDTGDQIDDLTDDQVEDDAPEDDDGPPAKDWQKEAQAREVALAKERTKRKQETQRARDLEARLEKLESGKSTAANDAELLKLAESLRDDDDDPITDIAALKRFAKQYAAEQRALQEQDQAATQQQRVVQQITQRMADAETDFADDNPDYYDAAKYFREQRREELEDLGYAGTALQRELNNDLLGIVSRALQAGRDPAEAVYNLAKKRGFGVDGVAKKLQALQRGQGASRSLSTAGGKTGSTELTAASVANLKGAAFDAAFAKLRAQAKRGN